LEGKGENVMDEILGKLCIRCWAEEYMYIHGSENEERGAYPALCIGTRLGKGVLSRLRAMAIVFPSIERH